MTQAVCSPESPTERRPTRRSFIKWLGAGALALASTGAFSYRVETQWLELRHQTLRIPGLAQRWDGQRIVQLSDLHASPSVNPALILEAFAMASACRPAFIAVTGDWITSDLKQFEVLERALKPLDVPVVGVLGNHDYGHQWQDRALADEITRRLRRMGIRLLRNSLWRPYGGAGELCVAGVDDLWAKTADPGVLADLDPKASVLVLAHNPDLYESLAGYRWHGMLCGHTHGGQVQIPGYGPLIVPVEHKERYAGAYYPDGRLVYVNRGVGHVVHFRLFCRPEVTCLTLERSEPSGRA